MVRSLLATTIAAASIVATISAGSAAPTIEDTNYVETVVGTCTTLFCRPTFSEIPKNKVVMISDVSCALTVPTVSPIHAMVLLNRTSNGVGGLIGPTYLLPDLVAVQGGRTYYQVQQRVKHIARDAETLTDMEDPQTPIPVTLHPEVSVQFANKVSGPVSYTCTISGAIKTRS